MIDNLASSNAHSSKLDNPYEPRLYGKIDWHFASVFCGSAHLCRRIDGGRLLFLDQYRSAEPLEVVVVIGNDVVTRSQTEEKRERTENLLRWCTCCGESHLFRRHFCDQLGNPSNLCLQKRRHLMANFGMDGRQGGHVVH